MKRLFLLLSIALLMVACSSDDGPETNDYTFVSTLTTSISPSMAGYPQTVTSVTEQKGITEAQAKEVAAKMTYSSTATSGGYRVTTSMVTKYMLSSKYNAGTGARIVL